MAWTTHLLVIANRTVDSDELHESLVARARAGPIDVTLLAPTTESEGEDDARAATAQRLLDAVQNLRHAGVRVSGILGDPDPMLALDEVWDPRRFDEVVVVTLPRRTSRWLAADLPRRVERFTGARVTHVMAKSRGKVTV